MNRIEEYEALFKERETTPENMESTEKGKYFPEKTPDSGFIRWKSGRLLCGVCPAGEPVGSLCTGLRKYSPDLRSGQGSQLVAQPVRRRGA